MLNSNIPKPLSSKSLRNRAAAFRSARVSVGKSKNTSTHIHLYWFSLENLFLLICYLEFNRAIFIQIQDIVISYLSLKNTRASYWSFDSWLSSRGFVYHQ